MDSVDPLEFFRAWLLEDPTVRVPLTLTALGVLFVLPLVGFAAYIWRMAKQVIAERTFPPSGYMTVGSTPPITGDDAIRYARLARGLALILIVAALILVFQLWRFAVVLAPRTGS
jgi:uncharacterized membrane protein